MNTLSEKEIEFINECIEHYWEDWNRDHPDNEQNKKISDKLVKKLTISGVVGRSEQLKCEHKGRRTATELVEYCEDCKKILFHP